MEVKEEIVKLNDEGVPAGKIAEKLGYTPEQIYSQLNYLRQKAKAFHPAEPNAEPEELSVPAKQEAVNLEEQLRKLKNEDVVLDLTEMFSHLKNLFSMVREYELLESDIGFVGMDTLAVAGESLCDTYINRLEEVIGSIL
jgi:transposase-like protein